MKKHLRILAILTLAGAMSLSAAPAFASNGHGGHAAAYVCRGGDIPSGTYRSITVAGPCAVAADAVITVKGGVTVRKGAMLDAQSAPSTMTVGGGVVAERGSMLGLGCQPPADTGNSAHPCAAAPDGHSTITVRGGITAIGANVVLLNGITVKHDVTVIGGGDPVIPWSIKNNRVGGSITVAGQTTEWIGVMFNTVGRDVTLLKITINDPDPGAPGVFVVRNTIKRNLTCAWITPGVSGGFVPGSVNTVGRKAYGQCAALV